MFVNICAESASHTLYTQTHTHTQGQMCICVANATTIVFALFECAFLMNYLFIFTEMHKLHCKCCGCGLELNCAHGCHI